MSDYETSVNKIISIYKMRKQMSEVKSIISHLKSHYILHTSLQHSNLKIKLYFESCESQTYTFKYVRALKKFVAFIPKKDIVELLVCVHFFSEQGQNITDPSYATTYEDGICYNTINFRKIQKADKERKDKNAKWIKQYCQLKPKEKIPLVAKAAKAVKLVEKAPKKSFLEKKEDFSKDVSLNLDYNRSHSDSETKEEKKSVVSIKTVKSMHNLKSVKCCKSILKSKFKNKSPEKEKEKIKKITFGKVEIENYIKRSINIAAQI